VAGRGENEAYVALRQMAHLCRPRVAVGIETVSAVSEGFYGGDLVLVREAVRCLVPAGLATNICDDHHLFPSEAMRREILDAPPAACDDDLVSAAASALAGPLPPVCVQVDVATARAGCCGFPPAHAVVRRWVNSRFGVEVVGVNSYGFLTAARDLRIPSVAFGVVSDACAEDEALEFRRHARRYWKAASLLILRAAAALVTLGPETVFPAPNPSA